MENISSVNSNSNQSSYEYLSSLADEELSTPPDNMVEEHEESSGVNIVGVNDPRKFKVFEENEIIKVHQLRNAHHNLGTGVVRCGLQFKNVILQQGTTSCTQAVTAMLLLDNNKSIDEFNLSGTHGSNHNIIQDLEEKGLKPSEYSPQHIKEIKKPSIVTLNIDGNGHVVIVDDIKKDAVTIRDPYHGWMVDVDKKAFKKAVDLKEKAIFLECPTKAKAFNDDDVLPQINKENRDYPEANLNEKVLGEKDESSSVNEEEQGFSLEALLKD